MQIGLILAGVSALVFFAGLASVHFGRKTRKLALASASWPQTTGIVTSLGITEHERETNNSSYTVYRPKIEYTYEVAGRPYTGQRLRFSSSEASSPAQVQKLVAPFAPGRPATVYYDPADPRSSTLDTSVAGTRASEIIGLVLALAGTIGIVVGIYLNTTLAQ